MNLRLHVSILCIVVSALPSAAQTAKELFERAKNEGSDRARQVQDYCEAAAMQPKQKNFVDTCNSYRAGLIQDDQSWLAVALIAYRSHDLDKAAINAKRVTTYDPNLSAKANALLAQIKTDRVAPVKAAWEKGDFSAVVSLEREITDPDARAAANVYVNNVNLYSGYVAQASKLQAENPQEAIRLLALAQNLNANGPDNPSLRIAEIQKAMQAKNTPPPTPAPAPAPTIKTPPNPAADLAKKVNKALADAKEAEKQGNLQDALNDYAMVLKLQPNNQDAQANTERIKATIRNDPAAAKKELASGIRYFYLGQFDDARRALMDYLESPQPDRSPGVADFYLGASLLEQSLLETPRAQWQGPSPDALSAFIEARKANYKPVREYVSPSLLKVWDKTTQ